MKVGVLSVLATATIAAPLAAAAAGIDETSGQGDTVASQLPDSAAAEPAAASAAPVALPVADVAESAQSATEARESGSEANRSTERTSTSENADEAAEDSEKADKAEAEAEAEAAEAEKSEKSEDSDKAEDSETTDGAEADSTGIEVSAPAPEPEPGAEISEEAAESDGEDASASTGGYIKPVSGPITSGFGGRVHPVLGYFKGHNGVDFGAACGTPVKVAKAGEVVAVEFNSSSGNRVKVDHGNGVVTGYYHLQGFNTSVGATVEQGDVVGYVGSTGRSTGCHLHFAKMDEAGNYSNPMSLLQ